MQDIGKLGALEPQADIGSGAGCDVAHGTGAGQADPADAEVQIVLDGATPDQGPGGFEPPGQLERLAVHPSATFADARAATVQAALDLFGDAEANEVRAAWSAVGVE